MVVVEARIESDVELILRDISRIRDGDVKEAWDRLEQCLLSMRADSTIPVTESPAPSIVPLPSDDRAEVTWRSEQPSGVWVPRQGPRTIAGELRVLRVLGQPRSFVRRIAERLTLGVAALALFGIWVWIAGQTPSTTDTLPLDSTKPSPATLAPPATAITNPESRSQIPAWFSPQIILYWPIVAPSTPPPRAEVPVPSPARTGRVPQGAGPLNLLPGSAKLGIRP